MKCVAVSIIARKNTNLHTYTIQLGKKSNKKRIGKRTNWNGDNSNLGQNKSLPIGGFC